jgi:hypothetical protein
LGLSIVYLIYPFSMHDTLYPKLKLLTDSL